MADERALADRLPPHNREAERSVLGSMLRDNKIIPDVVQILRAEDFYVFAHQKIYEAMADINVNQGKPADAVTLADYLNEKQLIEDVGGYAVFRGIVGCRSQRRQCRLLWRNRSPKSHRPQSDSCLQRIAARCLRSGDARRTNCSIRAERRILEVAEWA